MGLAPRRHEEQMMNAIHCPQCGSEIEITELMRAHLEIEVRANIKGEFEQKALAATALADDRVRQKDAELSEARRMLGDAGAKEAELLKKQREVDEQKQRLDLDVERRVADESTRIREQEAKAAQERYGREADDRIRVKDAELVEARGSLAAAATKEAGLLKKHREVEDRERQLEVNIERRVADETAKIRDQEAKVARERYAREADVRVELKETELVEARGKLAEAATNEAALMKKQREVEERERQLPIDVERLLAEETKRVREQEAKFEEQRAEVDREQRRLHDEEHRQQIEGMQKHITALQRRAEQGSQQLQGEAQEVLLRDLLIETFSDDAVEDVPKGAHGADALHRVHAADGRDCGTIVWESKRTKAWSDEWLTKARDDQRAAGAACAVIVTQVLPAEVRHFGLKDGVWVCAWAYAAGLGAALRATLVEVAMAKRVAEGRGEKMHMLFEYLTGTEFRNRVGGFVEAFKEMQDDLESEKRAMLTRWKRRGKLMQRASDNITAFYGDLGGIAGRQLKDLPSLSLDPALALPPFDTEEDDAVESEPPRDDTELKAVFYALVPEDGSTAGNGSLTARFVERALTELGVLATPMDYERCKSALLTEGRIFRGRGKGGSVFRGSATELE